MEKLKKVIEEYGSWSHLLILIDRIEAHIYTDFSVSVENAKSLLESISKQICKSKNISLDTNKSINSVLKKAFKAIGYNNTDLVIQVSSALATIGQKMGDLRNEIGVTSHGRTLEELEERNKRVDDITKEFLIDTTVIIASFLIRTFENENPRLLSEKIKSRIEYSENEEFNDYWDDIYGEFTMGNYSYLASEILYFTDFKVYEEELKNYAVGDE